MNSIYNDITTLTIILMLGLYCVTTHKLSVSILSIALISLFAAFFYLLIGAPDVALTEAAVGAAVSSCIILAALTKYDYVIENDISHTKKLVPISCCIILFALLCYFTIELPIYGDINSIANQNVAHEYKKNLTDDIGIGSLVTGILASYRGFDTLGETFVVFTSGVALTLILKSKNEK